MARPRKAPPTLDDMAPPSDVDSMQAELLSLRADVQALAAYIVERDQLRRGAFGENVADIAREQ